VASAAALVACSLAPRSTDGQRALRPRRGGARCAEAEAAAVGAVPAAERAAKEQRRLRLAVVAAVVVAALVGVFAFVQEPWEQAALGSVCHRLIQQMGSMGCLGYVVFVVLYSTLDLVGVPPVALAASAGAVFGAPGGFAAVLLGGCGGATAAFLLGRWLLQARIRRFAGSSPTFGAVEQAVAKRAFKVVFMMRLVPTPIPGLNYLLGATGVRCRTYLLATLMGYLPSTAFFVSLGVAGKEVANGGAYTLTALQGYPWYVYVLGSLAASTLALWIMASARDILKEVRAAMDPDVGEIASGMTVER